MSFITLGLSDALLRAVADQGYVTPTPIQMQSIPAILAGHDVMAGAQTGTGKTAGFTLPILHRLSTAPVPTRPTAPVPRGKRCSIRALILTPTRELAAQVEESVRAYGRYLPLTSMTMFGGVSMQQQVYRLKQPVDILVATPGRLLDHVRQGTIDLSQVEILVLDEADRMLDMGFIRDIRRILDLLPQQRQNLLFSATFSQQLKGLAAGFLHQPVTIEAARRQITADTITQKVYWVERDQKRQVLVHLIRQENWYQVLVFTRTKHGADRLVKQLAADRIPAMAIHGNKSQGARTRTLAKFKEGSLQVLVATDIAARGIDIDELAQVINFDLPNVPEDYVHRIGRTGRAGAAGAATSLVCPEEEPLLADIEKLLKFSLAKEVIDGFEPATHFQSTPVQTERQPKREHSPRRLVESGKRTAHASPAAPKPKLAGGASLRAKVSQRTPDHHPKHH